MSTRESNKTAAHSVLRAQALNATAQKRVSSEDREASASRSSKKRKRNANSVVESGSSVVAAAGVSQPVASSNSTADPPSIATAASPSPAKDKDKKRRRKKKKMSVVAHEGSESGSKVKPRSDASVAASSSSTPLSPGSARLVNAIQDKGSGDAVALGTRSHKRKGKQKAHSPMPASQAELPPSTQQMQSTQIDVAQAQIDDLKKQLETQLQLLRKHQTHIASVHQSLTCQICLDLLYKPFALTPCGHVACYDCLVRWFTSSGPGRANNDQNNTVQNGASGNHVRKRKTCPICRAQVVERPVEVWSIKDMVTGLVRSGLVEIPATNQTQGGGNGETNQNNAGDSWKRIFAPARGQRLPVNQWDERVPGEPEEVGYYDAEDNVHRCIDCLHEIWGRRCSNCNRDYPGQDSDEEDEDLMDFEGQGNHRHMWLEHLQRVIEGIEVADDDDDDDDEDIEISDDYGSEDEDHGDIWGYSDTYSIDEDGEEEATGYIEEVEDDEGEEEDREEDEEEGYESFIDDDDEIEVEQTLNTLPRQRSRTHIVVDSDEDESEVEDVRTAARLTRLEGRRGCGGDGATQQGQGPVIEISEEEDEWRRGGTGTNNRRNRRRPRGGRQRDAGRRVL
ncbi:hypothetical protein AMATHDRAFT_59580 [Amanita thiersii Skay4041]|uniref:RING-type domain-containing protein n=1 Tax=Amanita thiersii Skay4041 TaxID=703135 RepID=A0A2A9NTZ3_9AGAR|nr:hypothetical protein AMATHDRAFT_59580 [Amanita thiersii Skay4041]